MLKHIIIEPLKTIDNGKKILKAATEKIYLIYRGKLFHVTVDFSLETIEYEKKYHTF